MSDIKQLLPPSVTSSEVSIETVMAERTDGIDAPISRLWNVDSCPEGVLPFMAWAFSVEVWDHSWAETVKRRVIRDAIGIHRIKGTRGAVEASLASLGMEIDLTEWFQDGSEPHTFRLDVLIEEVFKAGFRINPFLVAEVDRVIINAKPVRSRYEMRLGERMSADVYLRTGVGQRQTHSASHNPLPRSTKAASAPSVRAGVRVHQISKFTHDVLTRSAA